jgi:chitodextrinase
MGNAEYNDPVPGFGDSMGNPIIAYFSGSKVSWQSSTVTTNGQLLPHQVVAPNSSTNPYRGANEICLITNSVLPKGAVINVSISFAQDGISKILQWSFKTSSSGLFDPVAATSSLPNIRSNNSPVISGTAILPNSPRTNETVSFSASATDPDGNPLSYSWNFGDGGQASGASATHSYGSVGTFAVVLTVSDDKGGSVSARSYVSVVTPANLSPAISSSPTIQPSDPTVAQDILFTVSASDPDGDTLSYSWDFGDGCSVVGCPVYHSYQLTTSYNVVVSVSDGRGGSATSSIVVTVRQSSISDVDTDGDGFPDEIETAVGSNSQDQNSTPFGWATVTSTEPAINSLLIKLNFGIPNRDNLRISGSFPLDSEILLENQPVVVDIGGVIKSFVLDTKGSNTPKSRTESFKVRICNVSGQPTAKFSAKVTGDLDDKFIEEGLSNADVTGQARIPVIILIGQKVFRKDLSGDYTAKIGRKGAWTTSK